MAEHSRILWLVRGLLALVGVIHLLPLIGVLGAEQLLKLYAVDATEPNLQILLRHRAVLFGLLGGFCFLAVVQVRYLVLALVAGSISVGSFLVLSFAIGEYNDALRGVVIADWIAAAALVLASTLLMFSSRTSKDSD